MQVFSSDITPIIAVIVAFGIIVTASNHLAKIFQKIKLPLITGFIIIGVLTGPYLLKMLPGDLRHLGFINDISLAFIALASGSEMFLKEIRDKIKDISIMTAAQFIIIFTVSFILTYLFSDYIPFLNGINHNIKISVALLTAVIFTASSPASAIAVINELRAKGRFTKIALGVTIVKDVFVILFFSGIFAVTEFFLSGNVFNAQAVISVFIGLILSILFGILYGKIFELNFKIPKNEYLEITIILLLGWSMFYLSDVTTDILGTFSVHSVHLEALLIGIIASFYVTNNTEYREHFGKILHRFGHYVYAAFFTLIGATLTIDLLLKYWFVAFLLFGIRLIAIIFASVTGSLILKETKKEILSSWTPYITQAGVSLGLITLVSARFLGFGAEFEAILITVIIINQFIGPPLLKFALLKIGDAHIKSKEHETDFHKDVFILGIGGKAVMLARTLKREGYAVQIITDKPNVDTSACKVKVNLVEEINPKILSDLNFTSADSVVIFRKEDVAFEISELIYEHFGTPNIIVVLETHTNILRFQEIGVTVVAPTAALIALLEHYVRSPQATSILLGMQEARETEDIEVLADDIHARALRDLQFPIGILILSVTRNGEIILPKGYTRLRKHDIVTVVGSQEQIDLVRTKLQF